ncbi:MAG: FAD-dependent oxidoreductase [Sphingomonadaceae bacterium]|nr:FAD-dependent oxidoreductase [Sphingomonadaceae bacterium]
MRHVAIIGSGPAGYYTAEACLKTFGDQVQVDIVDRLPVPYGLIRSGVAPDHQSIKAVYKRYEGTSLSPQVRFVGNVTIGEDIAIDELRGLYDAVVLATGAPHDRPLGIPGEDLPGVMGSAAFVGWYNGHPDFARLDPPLGHGGAVVVGNGNVALDVARILAKTRDELAGSDIVNHAIDALDRSRVLRVTLLGRRGPQQIAMTPKELGELGHLARAAPHVDPADLPDPASDAALEPGLRKSVGHIRAFAANPREDAAVIIDFDFFARPVRIEGDGRAERIIVERTRLTEGGSAEGTGELYEIPCGLVVACIGYRTPPIPGIPYDEKLGRFANEDGRIAVGGPDANGAGGLYAVGWARRGPTGTIGTNRPDGFAIVDLIAADTEAGSTRQGAAGLDALLLERGVRAVGFGDWRRIEAAENARARAGSPREKFVDLAAMLAAVEG